MVKPQALQALLPAAPTVSAQFEHVEELLARVIHYFDHLTCRILSSLYVAYHLDRRAPNIFWSKTLDSQDLWIQACIICAWSHDSLVGGLLTTPSMLFKTGWSAVVVDHGEGQREAYHIHTSFDSFTAITGLVFCRRTAVETDHVFLLSSSMAWDPLHFVKACGLWWRIHSLLTPWLSLFGFIKYMLRV